MKAGRIIFVLLLQVAVLASCRRAAPNAGTATLNIAIEFPSTPSATKADVTEIPASAAENAVHELALWVFNHETQELVAPPIITSAAADLPTVGGVRKYAIPLTKEFILARPNVDVFVLVNGSTVGLTLGETSSWEDLNNAVFGGNDYFDPSNPTQTVPATGLPMSGVGMDMPLSGEEPMLTIPTISVGRAVSKLRYFFSQMYTEDNTEEEFSVQKVVLNGYQIPANEYVFSAGDYRIVPDSYVGASMETLWPEGVALGATDTPERYSYAGQDGPTYDKIIADGIAKGDISDLGTYYLRESDKKLSGTIYYTITKKGQNGEPDVDEAKTLPFEMDAPGDFARNHTWTLYGYFISNRTLLLAVNVMSWDKNNYTIEFSTAALQVTQKFTVDKSSASIVPVQGQKDHYNVFLDLEKPARGYLYVTTPQNGKLAIIPEGSVSSLAAFDVNPKEAPINPSLNGGRIDITIDRVRPYTGDPTGKTITLTFKAYTPDGEREISGSSECIDQVYHFYL